MDKETLLEIISDFKNDLEQNGTRIDRIILFGSYAKGTQKEESDIDLVVISDDFKDKSAWQRIEIVSDAIYKIREPIEAVTLTPEEWENEESIIVEFAKDGEVVFSA